MDVSLNERDRPREEPLDLPPALLRRSSLLGVEGQLRVAGVGTTGVEWKGDWERKILAGRISKWAISKTQ